jgi:uncharacterized protein YjiS (DUF1127 family)
VLKRPEHPCWPEQTPRRFGFPTRCGEVLRAAFQTIGIWVDRAKKRRQLAQMSERQIKDLGASRSDVVREINKRFWEA